jgi:protein SCO1/2
MTASSLPFRAANVLVVVLALGLGALAARHFAAPPAPPAEFRSAAAYPQPRALPAVTVVDAAGRSAPASEQLGGSWRLVFFGFTHCPEVCPGALKTIDLALRQLQDLPADLQPVGTLVSVDPRRDTPAVIGPYVKAFNESFEGYTGEESAMDELAREVGVAVMRMPPDADGHYMVDHTSAVFVLDAEARVRGILTSPLTADNIAHDYRLLVKADRS